MCFRRSRNNLGVGRRLTAILAVGSVVAISAASLSRGVAAAAVVAGPSGDVAVVVNQNTPVENLSMGDLKSTVKGDRQFWRPNQRITILIRAPVAHERDVLLKKVYKMSEAEFKQYWVAKVFRTEAPSGPKVIYSNETALALINSLPGAIAFVDAGQVPKGVKIVKVDGLLPGSRGYPLN